MAGYHTKICRQPHILFSVVFQPPLQCRPQVLSFIICAGYHRQEVVGVLLVVRGAGHMALFEKPEIVNNAMEDFLARVYPPKPKPKKAKAAKKPAKKKPAAKKASKAKAKI